MIQRNILPPSLGLRRGVCFPEMFIVTYQTIMRCHNPADHNTNLIPYIEDLVLKDERGQKTVYSIVHKMTAVFLDLC
jgi:hypothetical protein